MVSVAWLAFLTPSAFGVPFTSSQDAKHPASVNETQTNGPLSRQYHRISLISVIDRFIE